MLCKPCLSTLGISRLCIQCFERKRRNGTENQGRCLSCARKHRLAALRKNTIDEVDVKLTKMRLMFADQELVTCGVLLREHLVDSIHDASLAVATMLDEKMSGLREFNDMQGIMVLKNAKAAYENIEWPAVDDFTYCWSDATTFLAFLEAIRRQLDKLKEHHDVLGRLADHIRICGLYLNDIDLFAAHLPQLVTCEGTDNSACVLAWQADVRNRICQTFCDETSIKFRNVFFSGFTQILSEQYGHMSTFWEDSSTPKVFRQFEENKDAKKEDEHGKDIFTPLSTIVPPRKPPPSDKEEQQHKVDKLTAMVRKVSQERMRKIITENPCGRRSTSLGAKRKPRTSGQPACGLSASSLAKVLVSLIKIVLEASQEEAIQIARQRCVQIDADVRCSISLSQTASEVTEQKECKKRGRAGNKKMSTQETMDDLRTALILMEQKVPQDAKKPEDAAEWPPGEIGIQDVQDLCPKGSFLRDDMTNQRYRIIYDGSACSRSWRVHGHAESLRQVVMWAWKQHTASTGSQCHVKGLFACFAGSASCSSVSEEPEDVAEWPAGDSIRIKDVKDRCPTGVVLRVQMNQQRYRVSYHGRQTTRSWRRDGHAESLRRIVQWAWKQHTDGTSTK